MPITRPDRRLPQPLKRRMMSLASEYYHFFRVGHALRAASLARMYPDPLSATAKELKQGRLTASAGGQGNVVRGALVQGDLGEGRFVGRHPTSGQPIIAWDIGAYDSMCEAYDRENAQRIHMWQRVAAPYHMTTAHCSMLALRIDRLIRWSLLIGVLLPTLLAVPSGLNVALTTAMMAGFMVPILIGLVIVVSFLLLVPLGMLRATIVGTRAALAARAAIQRDDEQRGSAAAVLQKARRPQDIQH